MTLDIKALATQVLDALDGPSLATDAGVIAILYHVAAYPYQTVADIAASTGFSEPQTEKYIDALLPFLTAASPGWELNKKGEDVLAGRASPGSARAIASLSPAQISRWEDVKGLVMDTARFSSSTLRKQMERYYEVLDGKRAPTQAERNEMHCDFMNQGASGIVFHRQGTVPIYDFANLKRTYELEESDEEIVQLALGAGLTFW